MRKLSFTLALLSSILLIPLVLTGCDSTDSTAEGNSHVRLLLTDAPQEDMAEAHVTVQRVELLGADDEVTVLMDEPAEFDLLELQNGVTTTLADLDIPDGLYTQLRVIVDDNAYVVYTDGTTEDLKVPSGTQTGIKMSIPDIPLEDDLAEIVLDFDLEDSFVQRGNSGKGYIFKPVLHPTSVQINGEDVDLDDSVEG